MEKRMATMPFEGFDFTDFWEYSLEDDNYVAPPFTDEDLERVEAELGYKLPESYVWMMRNQRNGGAPAKIYYVLDDDDPNTLEEVWMNQFFGIGIGGRNTLCGEYGTAFWLKEWEYPPIGVVIADTPSAGHEMIFLDYRECGPEGEPCITHIDQESDYAETLVAPDFETFVRGLITEEELDEIEDGGE